MHRKIDVYVNGEYCFSTNRFRTCKDVINHIRAVKHICIASAPENRYVTIYDYDKVVARYHK